MERRYEGLGNAVKNIVKAQKDQSKHLDYLDGILAEKIQTEVQYAGAVEAALEGLTDVLLVQDSGKLLQDQRTLSSLEGRVHFHCLDRVEPFVDDADFSPYPFVKGRLVEFVTCESRYAPLAWSLLGRTLVVDSLKAIGQLPDRMRIGYSFVTLGGESLSADGLLRLGPMGKATGLISRRSRISQLEGAIASLNAEIAQLDGEIQASSQNKVHLEKLCKELRTAINDASTEKTQVNSKLAMYERDIKRLKDEEPLIAGEIDSLESQIAQSVQREYDNKQRLSELETVNNQRKARIADLEERYNDLRDQQQDRMQDLTDLKVRLGQVLEQQRGLRQIIERLDGQMQASLRTLAGVEEEIRTGAGHLIEAQRDILACETAVSDLYVEKEAAQQANRLLREELETLVVEQKQKDEVVRTTRTQKTEIEHKINELRIELGQASVRQQGLIDRVKEELQIDLAQSYETRTTSSDVDWEQVKSEITELRGKIERLGNVNVDAIAEQETLEQRHNFLASQVQDLTASKKQLEELIDKLNKQSREKFVETFDQIRVNFQQIFRKLFGGGKADIVLEEADDVLEAGIEVIAKPPGKETRSISLLSGGEKSMTAMALLFAVFRAKPSPFLFLDEVDAALDEANNERFTMLLRDFGIDSQFIVITHSKRTMSVAQTLFGVTMQQQGVSKRIAVRFEEYDKETAAA
jgi:chromosome segregation protein